MNAGPARYDNDSADTKLPNGRRVVANNRAGNALPADSKIARHRKRSLKESAAWPIRVVVRI